MLPTTFQEWGAAHEASYEAHEQTWLGFTAQDNITASFVLFTLLFMLLGWLNGIPSPQFHGLSASFRSRQIASRERARRCRAPPSF